MQMFRPRDTVDALEDLLDKERAGILSGNFGVLRRLMVEKERLIKAATAPGTQRDLNRVRQKADRNQAMLLAASRGIRAVSQRLAHPDPADQPLQTYDRTGRRTEHTPTPNTSGRRA